MMYYRRKISLILLVPFILLAGCSSGDWRTASRDSANIAPKPNEFPDAIIQIYQAKAFGWRGWFASHPWIAVKKAGDSQYYIYDVVGWRGRNGQPVMRVYPDLPDRYWYGAKPDLLKEFRGEGVEALISKIDEAAHRYPWINQYRVFPGPNSNTFLAWIAQEVPELELDLPLRAIGKGYVNYYND